jgi:predicted amidophosphoribosyltransferase
MATHEAFPGAGSSDWRTVFSSRATLDRQRRMQRAEQRLFLVAPKLPVIRSVFSVFFPSACRLCSIPLTNISRLPLCPECLDSIEPVRVPPCVQCGGERLPPAQLLRGDGRLLAEAAPQLHRAGEYGRPLLVPVPLPAGKRGGRGFSQVELILAAVKQLPRPLETAAVLKRRRPTRSQVGLTRAERVTNQRDAFSVTAPERVRGLTVLLVDEAMTTGTTVVECARVLKKAGAERVWAAKVARTLKSAVLAETVEYGEQEAHEAVEVAVSV